MLPTRDPPLNKRLTQTESEGLEKIFQANGQAKKARLATVISDKIDFRTKTIKRDTEGHFVIFKRRIQQDINIINIYVPNIGAPKYIRKILEDFKKDIDSNTIIVGTLTPHCQRWTGLPNKMSTRVLWN